MRRTFYDILNDMPFSIVDEYEKLLYLFFREEKVVFSRYYNKISVYVNENYFRSLPIRGTENEINEFADKIGIFANQKSNNLNDLFVFCEFLFAMLPEEKIEMSSNKSFKDHAYTIIGNIKYILERTNHEMKWSDKYNNYIIVEKNKATTLAAEIVEDIEIAYDLIEYNHFALKGNLEAKKKILMSLGSYIEPILKNRMLQKSGYGKIESDLGFLLNKFHIRHNNKIGAKAQEYIVSLKDSDLELWYDRTYEMILMVIIINSNISVFEEIDVLKKTYKWKE